MAQTQFFTREENNLEEYKKKFNKALQKVKTVKLFPDEVISFFDKWIDAQTNYIPREDIDNFPQHLDKIFKEKDFYGFIVEELLTIKYNGQIQEYSFNLISKLDDSSKRFEEFKQKEKQQENLEKAKKKSKLVDEREMKKILAQL